MLAKTLGLTALLGVILFAVHAVAGPFFSLAAQRWGPEPRGDKLIGVVEGHLKSADVTTQTLRIASGFLGLDSVSLHVTTNTLIGVHGKLGGFGDLDRGELVRAVYEVASDRLVASHVDVLKAGSTAASTPIPTPLTEDTPPDRPAQNPGVVSPGAPTEPAVAEPVSVPDPPVEPERVAPELPERPEPRKTSTDGARPTRIGEAATPTPRAITAERPRRRRNVATEPAASPSPRRAAPPPATSIAGGSPAPASANAAPPRREEDAGAVIDWLLNSSPARGQ